ncbi:DUF1998 domain-containing protein [Nocardiopsis halophila]
MLEPTRVEARNRREDAQIRDDHDDRQRRYYEVATAVDIAREDIAPHAWRHSKRAFGVDFTRRAVIRRFNLGALRMDRPADTEFAGELVRHHPFHVCTECGGATPDRPDRGRSASVVTSGYDASPSHHRPWCRQRRGDDVEHLPLVLAHTLETEALRILVPAANILVRERTVTFRAAVMAGLARLYGGRLDHIAATTATMPDPQTGSTRRFLVVYDTLPGGSGYLNPKSGQEGIRQILSCALEVVAECPCKEQEDTAACHLCLLPHVAGPDFPYADRALAVEMLRELLDDWRTESVSATDEISLWDQVESELESRFLAALRTWASVPGTGRSFSGGGRVNDRLTGDLRLEGADGTLVSWRVILQNTIRDTRPDVVFQRRDAGAQRVAVYLDGYSYHASRSYNRLADDARKRAGLRAYGIPVFQLTWEDMDYWETGKVPEDPPWRPYGSAAETRARQYHQSKGASAEELPRTVWTSPVETLLAFLADPDQERWKGRAEAAAMGMLRTPEADGGPVKPEALGGALAEALRGGALSADPQAASGGVALVRSADASGLPVTLVADRRNRDAISAFVVIDDRDATIVAEEEAHKRRWRAWLYWGNLVQFLGDATGGGSGGDGAQIALTALGGFDLDALTAAGGEGLDERLARTLVADPELTQIITEITGTVPYTVVEQPSPERRPEPVVGGESDAREAEPAGAAAGASAVTAVPEPTGSEERSTAVETAAQGVPGLHQDGRAGAPEDDPEWAEVIGLLDDEEPGLESLARTLFARGVPAPQVGYELGDGLWPAELAWPDRRIAVVLGGYGHDGIGDGEAEKAKRDAAFEKADWKARGAREWDVSELVRRLGGTEG